MTFSHIPRYRLRNQHLTGKKFNTAAEVVHWFGAVQAQDYLGALWAVGLRLQHATEKAIEQALAERTIVRTWPMRGTLHFVAAEDVRWMLKLLTPRVMAGSRSRHRQLELDDDVFGRCREIVVSALSGRKQLSRRALYELLESEDITTTNSRGLHILGQLAHEGLICFGTREGKQQTFTLLDEWLPAQKPKERDEALAALARRYFTSHGPATLHDFAWWSGLTMSDANAGIELGRAHLTYETIAGKTYWLASSPSPVNSAATDAHLLPPFDEYTVAYKDRSAMLARLSATRADFGMGVLGPVIVIDGQVVGTWKRALNKSSVTITPSWFAKPKKSEQRALRAAASQYAAFLQQPAQFA
jgi:Winged helix DNA-binding domain